MLENKNHLTAALGLSGGLLALLLRRPLVGRGAGPRASARVRALRACAKEQS